MTIRQTEEKDLSELLQLYRSVADDPKGIARSQKEVNESYIQSIWRGVQDKGLGMVAVLDSRIIGEIHASQKGIHIFDHLLSFLTIGVSPDFQGKGVGKQLFRAFLSYIETHRTDIYRVELEARASNAAGIRVYESVGFLLEGRMKNQTRNADGSHEDGVAYAWFNKNYHHKV
jgi:ribosomal protein S18 acetylase RimI-like enzyme